jgi:hypothetical protein
LKDSFLRGVAMGIQEDREAIERLQREVPITLSEVLGAGPCRGDQLVKLVQMAGTLSEVELEGVLRYWREVLDFVEKRRQKESYNRLVATEPGPGQEGGEAKATYRL